MRPTRYAHCDGFTDLCYSDDGRYIMTCGNDGDIRIFEGLDDDDCKNHSTGADKLHGIAYTGDSILVGSDLNMVLSFSFNEGESNGIITRFTGAPTHVQISKNKNLIVAASSDMTIKVHDTVNYKDKLLIGHEAAVLSIAIDPKEKFIVSSSCDGAIKVWDISSSSTIASLPVLSKSSDFSLSSSLYRISWTSDGRYFIVPINSELRFYKRETWEKAFVLKANEVGEMMSVTAVSSCGKYVASGGRNGQVAVWNLMKRTCIFVAKHPRNLTVTALAFNPVRLEIAFANDGGEFGTIENIISSDEEKNVNKMSVDIFPPPELDDLADEADNDISIAKIKSQLGFADDEEGTFLGLPGENTVPIDEDAASEVPSQMERNIPTPVAPTLPEPQKPFQPGMSPEHLDERYMLWNNVGIIRQYNTTMENSVEIEFHDSSIHHALHINNNVGYTMAALSNEAIALASESQPDQSSKLVIHHFSAFDGSKEWIIDMPDGEDILATAIGCNWVAVATDRRYLRIFTITGLQKDVLSIPGPIVCMTGFEDTIFIVYHSGIGVSGEQFMSAMVLNLAQGGRHLLAHPTQLPLSPNSYLVWAGFTDEGTPLIMDTHGVVKMLNRRMGCSWSVILDTKAHTKGKSDNYFLIGASESQGNVRCILCKGSRYPPLIPRPHVSLLEFEIPVCNAGCEKSKLEDKMIRGNLLVHTMDSLSHRGFDVDVSKSEAEKTLKETLIKLFALACRSDLDSRCYDICQLMASHHTVELAIKYASKIGKIQLATRLGALAEKKMDEEKLLLEQAMVASSNYENETETTAGTSQIVEDDPEQIDNPLVAAYTKQMSRGENSPNTSLLSTPTERNPFRKSSRGSSSTPKGICGLDSLKPPKKSQENNVLKPIVRKPKAKQMTLQISSESKTQEKENLSNSANTSVATSSPQIKKSALQLWFEDNKSIVMEKFPGVPENSLLAKSALLFKDVHDEVKEKYKQLASGSNSSSEDSKKRPIVDSELPPEKKSKSTASKLASFAFNKDKTL